MEFKRVRKGIYEADNGMMLEGHFIDGEKAWYVYKDGEVVIRKYALDDVILWIERNEA